MKSSPANNDLEFLNAKCAALVRSGNGLFPDLQDDLTILSEEPKDRERFYETFKASWIFHYLLFGMAFAKRPPNASKGLFDESSPVKVARKSGSNFFEFALGSGSDRSPLTESHVALLEVFAEVWYAASSALHAEATTGKKCLRLSGFRHTARFRTDHPHDVSLEILSAWLDTNMCEPLTSASGDHIERFKVNAIPGAWVGCAGPSNEYGGKTFSDDPFSTDDRLVSLRCFPAFFSDYGCFGTLLTAKKGAKASLNCAQLSPKEVVLTDGRDHETKLRNDMLQNGYGPLIASSIGKPIEGDFDHTLLIAFGAMAGTPPATHRAGSCFFHLGLRGDEKSIRAIERTICHGIKTLQSEVFLLVANSALSELAEERNKLETEQVRLKEKSALLKALEGPMRDVSAHLSRATADMVQLQGIYSKPIRGAYERAPLLARFLKPGCSKIFDHELTQSIDHTANYVNILDARAVLKGLMIAWLGFDTVHPNAEAQALWSDPALLWAKFQGTSGRPDEKVNKLFASLMSEAARSKPFVDVCLGTDTAPLALVACNRAIALIKRQFHSNLKAAASNELWQRDLDFALPGSISWSGSFRERSHAAINPLLLPERMNPFPRGGDFVEFLSGLLMALAPSTYWQSNRYFGVGIITRNAMSIRFTINGEVPSEDARSTSAAPNETLRRLMSREWKSELHRHAAGSSGDLTATIFDALVLCASNDTYELVPTFDHATGVLIFSWSKTLREKTQTLNVSTNLLDKFVFLEVHDGS